MSNYQKSPAEKTGATNHRRAEARKERRQAERAEREAIREKLTAIIKSPTITQGERLKAIELYFQNFPIITH